MRPANGALLTCALGLVAVCTACHSNGRVEDQEEPDKSKMDVSDRGPSEHDGPDHDDGPAVNVVGAANQADVRSPMDATPSPDGSLVYFLATQQAQAGQDGQVGQTGDVGALYRANADGSDATALLVGAPLSAPVGIAISLDGETLFIADMTATGEGAILAGPSDPSGPGAFAPIAGTEGLTPRAISVARVDDRQWLYFSGRVEDGSEPALFRVGAEGDGLETLAVGGKLAAPAGVMASADGTVYTIDALADDGRAALLQVRDGEVERMVDGLGVGFPAGLTLDLAETTALISGLSPETGRDIVYVVDLESRALSTISDPVDAYAEPAGLHRAHDQNIFAWADSEAMDTGTVFVLSL